jgi:hypothetical protein
MMKLWLPVQDDESNAKMSSDNFLNALNHGISVLQDVADFEPTPIRNNNDDRIVNDRTSSSSFSTMMMNKPHPAFEQFTMRSDEQFTMRIEPTPISNTNIKVVKEIPLTSVPGLQHSSYASIMRSFLVDSKQEKEKWFHDNCYNSDDGVATVGGSGGSSGVGGDDDGEEEDETTTSLASSSDDSDSKLRPGHLEQWNIRYQELVDFKHKFKHCLVPLQWPENTGLAHWVKRQRHQYILKSEGKHSTLTEERELALENLGFIWNSHAAAWEERRQELEEFRDQHGHW